MNARWLRSYNLPIVPVLTSVWFGACYSPPENASFDGESSDESGSEFEEAGAEESSGYSSEGKSDEESSDKGSQRECEEPNVDCPEPEQLCREAYCDEMHQCAEREREDGEVVEPWSEWEECAYESDCSEEGMKRRVRTLCEGGDAKEVEAFESCARTTEGNVIEEGEWGPCVAEGENSEECEERRYRTDKVCREGSPSEEEVSEECEASGIEACGVCGNGIVEDGEVCEPGDDYCGECRWVLFVDVNVPPGGDSNGSSWENAYTDLQAAFDRAKVDYADRGYDVEVWVADGTYVRKGGEAREGFEVPGKISVYGGFEGNETEKSQRNAGPEETKTILSGDLDGNDRAWNPQNIDDARRSENSYHVVKIIGEDGPVKLDGFVIRGGNADGESSDEGIGGGVAILSEANGYLPDDSGEPGLSFFSSNSNRQTPTTLENFEFSNLLIEENGGEGGGLSLADHTLVIRERVVIRDNSAGSGSAGGLLASGGRIEVRGELELSNNRAAFFGGGVHVSGSTISVHSGSTFSVQNNTATGSVGGFSVGLAIFSGSPGHLIADGDGATIEILDNMALDGDGGGLLCVGSDDDSGSIKVTNGASMEVSGNEASKDGGGIYIYTYCTLSEGSPASGNIFGDGNIVGDTGKGGGLFNRSPSSDNLIGNFTDLRGNKANVYQDPEG